MFAVLTIIRKTWIGNWSKPYNVLITEKYDVCPKYETDEPKN